MLQELFVRLAVQATVAGDLENRHNNGEMEALRSMALDAQLQADSLASAMNQSLLQATLDSQGPDHGGTGGLGGKRTCLRGSST